MAQLDGTPYWEDSSSMSRYPALDRDLTVDVVVIGAGITGLTAAYLLKRAGRVGRRDRSRALRRRRHGAHDRARHLRHRARPHRARRSTSAAITRRRRGTRGSPPSVEIDTIVRDRRHRLRLGVGARLQAFAALDADPDEGASSACRDEAALAAELGFDATYLDDVPFVRTVRASRSTARRGSIRGSIWRRSPSASTATDRTSSSRPNPRRSLTSRSSVKAGGHTISCDYVVIATHTPLMGKTNIASATLFQTKLSLYTSYVVGGRVPKGIGSRRALLGHRGSRITTCGSIRIATTTT